VRFLTDARRRHPHHSDLIDCDPVWRGRVESSVAERSKRQTPWPPHPNPPGGSVVMDAHGQLAEAGTFLEDLDARESSSTQSPVASFWKHPFFAIFLLLASDRAPY